MPAQKLRDYQQRGLSEITAAYRDGARRVLAVSPTGSGKTTIFGSLVAQLPKTPVVILTHRRELAEQAANRLREFGVDFGFQVAGLPRNGSRVQVATVQSLVRRAAPPAKLVICDEAHLSTAKTWSTILEHYSDALVLGVTATPWRLGGQPLSGTYDKLVVVAQPTELRAQGHLCPYNGFSYRAPDLSKVKVTAGEYNERESAEAMRAPGIVDNVVEQWLAHASDLSTVVFNVTVEHSLEVTEKFKTAGVRAEHLDGATPLDARRAILRRVASGETQVLCNVGVAVEGIDIPRLKCCVLNRPTQSLARAIQMMGRVRRPWEGVTARIHDHAFIIRRHGLPDAERDYVLSAGATADLDELPALTTCSACFALYSGPRCPACEHENEPAPRGDIERITDAEQFTFDSGEADLGAEARKMLPPVRVAWGPQSLGRVLEGIFEGTWTERTQFGPQKVYRIKGAKRDYDFPGTTVLNAKMAAVKPGTRVRATFTHETPIGGGRQRKEFTVETNEEPDPGETKKAEAKRLYVDKKMSTVKVAKIISVSPSTVYDWGKMGGWLRTLAESRNPDPSLIARAKQLATSGMTTTDIAKSVGLTKTCINFWARRGGWAKTPSEAQNILAASRAEKIKPFLAECCVVAPGARVDRRVLYAAWCAWAKTQGREHPGTIAMFSRGLLLLVPGRRRARMNGVNGAGYEGIGLASQIRDSQGATL